MAVVAFRVPSSIRGYLKEPAIADPPTRVWRDWALVGAASVAALLEATLRTDAEWTALPAGWRLAATGLFFLVVPITLLERRRRPLAMIVFGMVTMIGFGAVAAIVDRPTGGLISEVVVLIVVYALYRWGSGRDGAIGIAVLLVADLVANITDAGNAGDVIGGLIVLSLPVVIGLMVRYRGAARERAIDEVKSRERADLARELHDTVAHHVSAIAVQAQAGQALAAADPDRALEVLAVIESAASTTLAEMRAMVGTLRNGAEAESLPQQGVADLERLARAVPGRLAVDVTIDERLGPVGPAVGAAIYRIAQESITNAMRHARSAGRVEVNVVPDGEFVRLTVTDDGTGSDPTGREGFGLLGMAERAYLLGGHFEAGPTGTRGWRVTADLPRTEVGS